MRLPAWIFLRKMVFIRPRGSAVSLVVAIAAKTVEVLRVDRRRHNCAGARSALRALLTLCLTSYPVLSYIPAHQQDSCHCYSNAPRLAVGLAALVEALSAPLELRQQEGRRMDKGEEHHSDYILRTSNRQRWFVAFGHASNSSHRSNAQSYYQIFTVKSSPLLT